MGQTEVLFWENKMKSDNTKENAKD